MKLTPYKDINTILSLLKKGLVENLGDNLVGLYLTGSLTYDDFDRGSSDIDFLAVVKVELTTKIIKEIKKLHESIGKRYPEWALRTEGSYIPKVWLRSTKTPSGKRPYINRGIIKWARNGDEWMLNLFVLHKYGITIYGPEPKLLFKKVSLEDVRQSSKNYLLKEWKPRLKVKDPFTYRNFDSNHIKAYTILTMCRILYTPHIAEVASKRVAATWAKKKYPQWKDLIEEAEDWEHGKEIKKHEEIKEFIRFTIDEITRGNSKL